MTLSRVHEHATYYCFLFCFIYRTGETIPVIKVYDVDEVLVEIDNAG